MGWARDAIEALRRGETVTICPRGDSMAPLVNDGDLVTLAPVNPATLRPGDMVLVRVERSNFLHLVTAVDGARWQIGNNRGGINGWVDADAIYGIAVHVERQSPERDKPWQKRRRGR